MIGDRKAIAAECSLIQKSSIEEVCTVSNVDAIVVDGQRCTVTLHLQNLHQIADLLGKPVGYVRLEFFEDLTADECFIMDAAFYIKESIVDANYRMLLQKLLAEYDLIDAIELQPCGCVLHVFTSFQ